MSPTLRRGSENWSAVFTGVPDFRAELIRVDAAGDTAWSEWRWEGTQADGGRLDMAGVIVFGVRDDVFAWARLYVEPVERAGAGIDAAVRDMTTEPDRLGDPASRSEAQLRQLDAPSRACIRRTGRP